MEKARHLFQQALALDSTFALAYTGLADVYFIKNYWKTFLSEQFMDSVLILANKALTYDKQCAEAYYFKAIRYNQTGRQIEALKEIEKVIKYDPNDWRAYNLRGKILLYEFYDHVEGLKSKYEAIIRNRGDELPDLLAILGVDYIDIGFPEIGKKYIKQALELDGDSLRYLTRIAYAEYCNGYFEKAYQIEKSVYKRDSTKSDYLALYCLLTGRYEEKYILETRYIERLRKSGEIDLWISKGMGLYMWLNGRKKEAEFYFNQQIKICEESIRLGRMNAFPKGAHFDLAMVYAFLGNKEKAYYYLDEVNKNRAFPKWWLIFINYEPLFEPIRSEQRFQQIVSDIEAKYQAEHDRVGKWLKEQGMM